MTARNRKIRQQKGYMLLSVLLVMVIMLIALSIEVPRITQQIRREKEEELVHRGREYAIAIKRFYHKNGTYPVSLDQLESTNNLRFLRKRYKDPMTEKGEFKLVHVGESQINVPTTAAGINTQGGGLTGTPVNQPSGAASGTTGFGSNAGNSGFGSGSASGFNSGGMGSGGLGSGGLGSGGLGTGGLGSGGLGSGGLGSSGLNSGAQTQPGTPAPGSQPSTGQMGTLTTQNIGNGFGAGAQGGGPIIGVASTSKKTSIKEFNSAHEYDEWMFVYDPRVEQAGGGGIVIAAPTGMNANSSPGGTGSPSIPQPIQSVRTPDNQGNPTPQASPTPQ